MLREPHGRFEGSSAFPDVERKGISVEVGSLPALRLGNLASGRSTCLLLPDFSFLMGNLGNLS